MRKVNFNNLDNIEIPDSWADKAIKVQQNPKKDAPLVLFKVSRTLIAVASLVLVCTLSVTLFFFSQKDSVFPVVNPTVNTVVNSTKSTQNLSSSEKSDNTYNSKIKPTTSNSESSTSEPKEDVNETKNPTEKETTKPTQSPSSKPTQKPSAKPTIPTDKPTTPTQKPTTDENDEDYPESVAICEGSFSEELLLGYDKVYFSIVPDSEFTLDEMPEVSAMYEASIVSKHNGYVNVSFSPLESGIVNKSDYYNYYFYNINGDIIYAGQIYITVN